VSEPNWTDLISSLIQISNAAKPERQSKRTRNRSLPARRRLHRYKKKYVMKNNRFFLFALALMVWSCNHAQPKTHSKSNAPEAAATGEAVKKIVKSNAEWKAQLSEQAYYVLREAGTERAFTGKYADHHEEGVYTCGACELPLFDSKTKFESGTGWPSFYQPIKPQNVISHDDTSYGMTRTEVLCARCDGHLGHVFDDGPKPTGLRYCINSVSLNFQKAGKTSPKKD
jgi:peptide-methionine (R)-S-oxide reductase